MMRIFTKFLLLAFLSCCLVSCNNDDIDNPEEDKNYIFHSIMWKLDDGDGLEVLETEVHKVFYNDGDNVKDIVFNPMEEVEDYSYFHESEDLELLNKLSERDFDVVIPSEYSLLSTDYKYFMGIKAVWRMGEKVILEPSTKIETTTGLHPNTKLTEDVTIYQNKITATYCIRFVSEDDGHDYKEVQGKWTGVFFRDIVSESLLEEIDTQ